MRSQKPQSLAKLLNGQRPGSSAVLEHARLLRRLTQLVRAELPAACASHCRVASIRDSVLVLATDSPAWSSRLRFHGPELVRTLKRRHGLDLRSTRILVVPSKTSLAAPIRKRTDLSHKSAALLQEVAAGLSDSELKTALTRLARHARRRADD